MIAFLTRAQLYEAFFRFAGGDTPLDGFHAVIHRVAHQVYQWIVQILDHGFVHFCFFAGQHPLDILAQLPRQVARQAGIFFE